MANAQNFKILQIFQKNELLSYDSNIVNACLACSIGTHPKHGMEYIVKLTVPQLDPHWDNNDKQLLLLELFDYCQCWDNSL